MTSNNNPSSRNQKVTLRPSMRPFRGANTTRTISKYQSTPIKVTSRSDLEIGPQDLPPSPSKFRRRYKRTRRTLLPLQVLFLLWILGVAVQVRWSEKEVLSGIFTSNKLNSFIQSILGSTDNHMRNDGDNETNQTNVEDDGNHHDDTNSSNQVNHRFNTPFENFLSQVPFETLEEWSIDEYDAFFTSLQAFVRQEPLVPINSTCKSPPLLPPETITCDQVNTIPSRPPSFNHLFQGKRDVPAKVGHAIQFGSDVDTLEIHLHELYDVVDKFFIVEMVIQHNMLFPTKELTWDHVKKQSRFRKFQDKIVHIVLDDVAIAEMYATETNETIWKVEHFQEMYRWKRIQEWNDYTKFFGPDDLIGFGDTDEIASRENIQILKHCHFSRHIASIDIGIWFPYGKFDQAFASDFPVRDNRWTLGDPTFWTFKSAKFSRGKATRKRGKSPAHLLGGMHMSHYAYFPYLLLKTAMATEAFGGLATLQDRLERLRRAFYDQKLLELQNELALPPPDDGTLMRLVKLKDISPKFLKGVIYYPWFFECNRDRYPRWDGKPDSRLGI